MRESTSEGEGTTTSDQSRSSDQSRRQLTRNLDDINRQIDHDGPRMLRHTIRDDTTIQAYDRNLKTIDSTYQRAETILKNLIRDSGGSHEIENQLYDLYNTYLEQRNSVGELRQARVDSITSQYNDMMDPLKEQRKAIIRALNPPATDAPHESTSSASNGHPQYDVMRWPSN